MRRAANRAPMDPSDRRPQHLERLCVCGCAGAARKTRNQLESPHRALRRLRASECFDFFKGQIESFAVHDAVRFKVDNAELAPFGRAPVFGRRHPQCEAFSCQRAADAAGSGFVGIIHRHLLTELRTFAPVHVPLRLRLHQLINSGARNGPLILFQAR